MEILRDIASEISIVQAGLATGEMDSMTARDELNRVRRKVAAAIGTDPVADSIIAGYRADAVSQAIALSAMLGSDPAAMADSELFHLAACAHLVAVKVNYYFELRNSRAVETITASGEVDNG